MDLLSPRGREWVITTEEVLAAPCDDCGKPVREGDLLVIRLHFDGKGLERYHEGCRRPGMAGYLAGCTVKWDESYHG